MYVLNEEKKQSSNTNLHNFIIEHKNNLCLLSCRKNPVINSFCKLSLLMYFLKQFCIVHYENNASYL